MDKPQKAELDWKSLGFKFLPTHGIARVDYQDGQWGKPRFETAFDFSLHWAANCLHYGQAVFEGLKAFRTRAGKVVLFRPSSNAERMALSADRLCMPSPSQELFLETCKLAIQKNLDFVPPYGTGASLYLRPLLIGTEPTIGIKPSDTYAFVVLVTPVGPYYKDGFHPVNAVVIDAYDRAAPLGTGRAKMAGNYAASLKPMLEAKKMGYPINLFADPKEHRYVDEFGTSNFIGITRDRKYQTPDSPSILQSITNESLQVLAADLGFKVEKLPIPLAELDRFAEVGACGTAAVITPIHSVKWGERTFTFGNQGEAGKTLTDLYKQLQGIQYGDLEDRHHWLVDVG